MSFHHQYHLRLHNVALQYLTFVITLQDSCKITYNTRILHQTSGLTEGLQHWDFVRLAF